VEDITQRDDPFKLKIFIHNDQTVDAGFADCVENGIQPIIEGAGVDAREFLELVSKSTFLRLAPTRKKRKKITMSRNEKKESCIATYRRPFLQHFSNCQAQIIIYPTPNKGNHIH